MKDYKPRCGCGKYVGYQADNGTYYGCSDPESPEPYDPTYFCKTCANEEYYKMIMFCELYDGKEFQCSWWIKPEWYMKAIKKSGYVLQKEQGTFMYKLLQDSTKES